jgi:hypothetical protein
MSVDWIRQVEFIGSLAASISPLHTMMDRYCRYGIPSHWLSKEVLVLLEKILTGYLEKYVNHQFKSAKFLYDGENHFAG